MQSDLGVMPAHPGGEPELRQPTLDRHLPAFETYLVPTTRAGLLPLVPTTTSLAATASDTRAPRGSKPFDSPVPA